MSDILRWTQCGGAAVTLLLAAFVVWSAHEHNTHMGTQVHEQNATKMKNVRNRIQDFLGRARTDLRFISLDYRVQRMQPEARDCLRTAW